MGLENVRNSVSGARARFMSLQGTCRNQRTAQSRTREIRNRASNQPAACMTHGYSIDRCEIRILSGQIFAQRRSLVFGSEERSSAQFGNEKVDDLKMVVRSDDRR